MHYRFTPRRVFGAVASGAGVLAYLVLKLDLWTILGVWPLVILVASVLVAGGWWMWDALSDERHQRAMAKFARINSWEFAPQTQKYGPGLLSFPFGVGINQRNTSLISGTFNGRQCASFTHQYEVGSEKERMQNEAWQITLVELPHPLWTVDILPDDVVAKAAKAFGGMDVDFESAAFNAKWRVKSGNLKYAHDIVHPRMMERLLRSDAEGLAIRIEGAAVMCWQADRQGPEDLARRLGVLTSIAKLIPDFVLTEFEYEWKKIEEAARRRAENAPDWATTPFALSGGRYTELGKKLVRDEVNEGLPPVAPPYDGDERAW